MDEIIYYYFNLDIMKKAFPALLTGLVVTLEMAVLIIVLGLSGGLCLAVIRSFHFKPINILIIVFVDAFRAIPPLVIMILFYFAVPYAGVQLSSFSCAVLSLVLVLAAFAEEIFWAGIISVDRGQWEAARSTGLSFFQTLRYVVLLQAVRLAIPPLTNRTISITKSTALGSVVAVEEILNQATSQQAILANPSPLMLGAIFFLIIFAPLVRLTRWIERRYGWIR